jgi:hypothetical protein
MSLEESIGKKWGMLEYIITSTIEVFYYLFSISDEEGVRWLKI